MAANERKVRKPAGRNAARPLVRRSRKAASRKPNPTKLATLFKFGMAREYLDRHGLWNPRNGQKAKAGKSGYQINLVGTAKAWRELSKFCSALAEADTRQAGDCHEHIEVWSHEGNARIHLIVRRAEEFPWFD